MPRAYPSAIRLTTPDQPAAREPPPDSSPLEPVGDHLPVGREPEEEPGVAERKEVAVRPPQPLVERFAALRGDDPVPAGLEHEDREIAAAGGRLVRIETARFHVKTLEKLRPGPVECPSLAHEAGAAVRRTSSRAPT